MANHTKKRGLLVLFSLALAISIFVFIASAGLGIGAGAGTGDKTEGSMGQRSSSATGLPPVNHHHNDIEWCVELLFDPPSQRPPPPTIDNILCRDRLRVIGHSYRASGVLSPAYIEALKKVPRFKKNETSLKEFLHSACLTYLGDRCKD